MTTDPEEQPSGDQASRMADLGVRMASAIVLGPLVLLVVWLGGPVFVALAALAAAIVAWEWMLIVRGSGHDVPAGCAIAGAVLFVLLASAGWWLAAVAALAAGVAGSQLLAGRAPLVWAAALYSGPPIAALCLLRADAGLGFFAVVWLLVVVWTTDIGAYFAGRTIGGPRLWARISPGKTWAGSIGGAVAAVLCAAAALAVAEQRITVAVLLLAALLSVVSQVGDLVESALKRRFGAKDSSYLIPGHGGLMDRIDGLLAAAVAAAAVGISRGGVEGAGSGLLMW